MTKMTAYTVSTQTNDDIWTAGRDMVYFHYIPDFIESQRSQGQ